MSNDNIFGIYSNYYDLFYKNKNYQQESGYFLGVLNLFKPGSTHLLELGSGTGNFSTVFTNAGYFVTGIEKSVLMNEQAVKKAIDNFYPVVADMVNFELSQSFDAAFSLFDVMCYLTETSDIISCLKNVHKHLKKDGIFIFDGWYSPAVYSSNPAANIKRAESEHEEIRRISESTLNYNKKTVTVNYEFIVNNKSKGHFNTWTEMHTLRHFDIIEIELLAGLAGFNLLQAEEPRTSNAPGKNTWKICYVLQKK